MVIKYPSKKEDIYYKYDYLNESETDNLKSIYNIPLNYNSRLEKYVVPIEYIESALNENYYDNDIKNFDKTICNISKINKIKNEDICVSIDEGCMYEYGELLENSSSNFILSQMSKLNPDYQLINFLTEEYINTEDDNLLYIMENDDLWDELPELTKKKYDPNGIYSNPNDKGKHFKFLRNIPKKGIQKIKNYKEWAKANPKKFGKHVGYGLGAAAGLGFLGHRIAVLRKRMKELEQEKNNSSPKRKNVITRLIEKIKIMINKLLGKKNSLNRAYGRSL